MQSSLGVYIHIMSIIIVPYMWASMTFLPFFALRVWGGGGGLVLEFYGIEEMQIYIVSENIKSFH